MSELVYTPLYGKIPAYFKKFQETGIPGKVNRAWLKQVGFPGGNDQYIIGVLKHIGFIDQSNVPTDLWKQYKNPIEARAVMAEGIRRGYSNLFKLYDDAYRKDREAIFAYFSTSGKADRTIKAMVGTFFNLSQIADFEAKPIVAEPTTEPQVEQEPVAIRVERRKGVPEIHINIQLVLPETTDTSVYDRLFESMKKHLLTDEE